MKEAQIRNWLGLFFLFTTSFIGFYILLFGETPLLPIEKDIANATFGTIIPVFIGQLTLIFKWYSKNLSKSNDSLLDIPVWIVKGPPLIVLGMILITIITFVFTSYTEVVWKPSSETFQGIITFCVTLLNATTIFVIASLFKTDENKHNNI